MSVYYDTARSLYIAPCVACGGDGKLTPDGNQWEVKCATCGARAALARSPAEAVRNWNAKTLEALADVNER